MLTKLKNNKWFQSVLVGLYGFFVSALVYILDYFNYRESGMIEEAVPTSNLIVGSITAGIFVFIFLFIAYVIGKSCENKLQLERVKINKQNKYEFKFFIILLLISCVVVPIITTLFDYFLFMDRLPYFMPVEFNIFSMIQTAIYNPIFEGLIFRYALISLLVFTTQKVYDKKLGKLDYKNKWAYIPTIFSVCLLFSINLTSIINMYNALTGLLLFRALLTYFIMDVVYAYIYLKYGIKYSIVTHLLYIIVYVGMIPLLCSFF